MSHMLNATNKNKVDRLWLEFHSGGITNPLTVIEQITYLMFMRLLDMEEARREKQAARTGKPHDGVFDGPDDPLRWKNLRAIGDSDQLLKVVRDGMSKSKSAFAHLKEVAGPHSAFGRHMKDAVFMIPTGRLLSSAMEMINDLPLEQADAKGDLYEYLLGKLNTAGINGQFRTPRHIIRLMVDLMEPKLSDTITDPACGTAGFLVGVIEYLKEKHSSPAGIEVHKDDKGQEHKSHYGDLLSGSDWARMKNDMFHGYDFDSTMLRIAAMNMMAHGVDNPCIERMDTLSNSFTERKPKDASNRFDLILANPPFTGSLDEEQVDASLTRVVKTGKTELLFMALILRMLRLGGRSAVIVPAGVLFGASKAHKAVRQTLVDGNQLEAVIALPSGVFKPYAGVSTGILVFTKGGKTGDVLFFDVAGDGFTLDDNRRPDPANNDLPEVRKTWFAWKKGTKFTDRSAQAFTVPASEIREAGYDLSASRYAEKRFVEREYLGLGEYLDQLKSMENDVSAMRAEQEKALRRQEHHIYGTPTALKECASFIRGITFTPNELVPLDTPNSVVCMRTKNIQADLDLTDLIAVPAELIKRPEQYLTEGDMLISSANSWELVGKCCWVPRLGYKAAPGGFICALRVDRTKVLPRYLFHWITRDKTQHDLRHCARQTTNIANLSYERALELKVPIPFPNDPKKSLAEQARIVRFLDEADKVRRLHLQAANTAADLLASLSQQAFCGKL